MRAPSDIFDVYLDMYEGNVKFEKHKIKCYGEKKKAILPVQSPG